MGLSNSNALAFMQPYITFTEKYYYSCIPFETAKTNQVKSKSCSIPF